MELKRFFGRGITGLGLLFIGIVLLGCETTQPPPAFKFDPPPNAASAGNPAPAAPADMSGTVMHMGDAITVVFSDLVNALAPMDLTIKEDGTITLYYNQKFHADGKTIGALQEEIRERYVPEYFKNLTVTVKTQDRFYSVSGEVKTPNRFVFIGSMTLTRAIATAAGFTDFANKTSILLTRADGKTIKVNYKKAESDSQFDVPIYPGDIITVKKRFW